MLSAWEAVEFQDAKTSYVSIGRDLENDLILLLVFIVGKTEA